jgi:hypothetical protein
LFAYVTALNNGVNIDVFPPICGDSFLIGGLCVDIITKISYYYIFLN